IIPVPYKWAPGVSKAQIDSDLRVEL
ncbi:MAG: hypothetical protein RL169_162, partial [Armatimonadota bacterium]